MAACCGATTASPLAARSPRSAYFWSPCGLGPGVTLLLTLALSITAGVTASLLAHALPRLLVSQAPTQGVKSSGIASLRATRALGGFPAGNASAPSPAAVFGWTDFPVRPKYHLPPLHETDMSYHQLPPVYPLAPGRSGPKYLAHIQYVPFLRVFTARARICL